MEALQVLASSTRMVCKAMATPQLAKRSIIINSNAQPLLSSSSSSSSSSAKSKYWRPVDPASNQAEDRQLLFNRIAPIYDYMNDWLSLGQHRIWKRMAVSWSRAKEGDTVLDICCGSGDLSFLLAEKVGSEGKVIGLDFAQEQLVIASQRQREIGKHCYKNMEWVQGDALDLPFADSTLDAITVGYGLRNVVDIQQALQEILRVLKRGSTASILDFNKPTNSSVYQLEEWLLDNVVVPVATNFGLRDEYAYLKESIAGFLTGMEQEKLASGIGFSQARHYEIGGGLMGVLVVTK